MEANKHNIALKEYSVCQTSLEQIFNAFASQQDEEKGVARGMEVKKNLFGQINVCVNLEMPRKSRGVIHHITTLIWKNRIIKQRHWVTTTLEIAIPTLFVLLFAYFKTLSSNQNIPAGWPLGSSSQPVLLAYPTPKGPFGMSGSLIEKRFVATETSMSGLLLGLSYMATSNIVNTSRAEVAKCKIKFTYMGYVNTDPTATYAIPTECADTIVPYKIGIAPKNDYTVKYFGGLMDKWYPRVPLMNQSLGQYGAALAVPSFSDSVMYFNTIDDLQSYLTGSNYGLDAQHPNLYAAIVFDNAPQSPGVVGPVEYTLRMNSTQGKGGSAGITPHTDGIQNIPVNPLQKGLDTSWYPSYTINGFATLQTLMTKFLACAPSYSSSTVGACQASLSMANTSISASLMQQLWMDNAFLGGVSSMVSDTIVMQKLNTTNMTSFMMYVPNESIENLLTPLMQAPQSYIGNQVYPFPIKQYISAPFYDAIGNIFPLVFILAYLYAVSKVLVVLIQEKETKSRELMKILGVSESAIVMSWYITYIVIFAIGSILQALAGTLLFPNTNGGLLFIFFFLFSMTIMSYGFLVSTFFTNSRTGSLVGVSLFFIMYFVNSALSQGNEGRKMLASLLSPVALSQCIQTLANAEGVSEGINSATVGVLYSNFRFQGGLAMLVIDFILYTLLAMYLEQVVPKDYGTPQKWYFPVSPSYWFGDRSTHAKVSEAKVVDPSIKNDTIESVNPELQNQEHTGEALQIQGIRKVFSVPGGKKVAVKGVELVMYKDQITCLLGHNGAGKTTLISILTGMIPTTDGDAFFNGHRFTTQMHEIRKSLGMCPQHDVLYPDLTVEEHLEFYGSIKGYTGRDLIDTVNEKIKEVGLTEKRKVFSSALSGGMKRKLSIAIALLGDSRLVFLDEPTSGMDPYSRRSTWELILNNRMNRVIVLTTHFMDEADILGDRIAIMAEGQVKCCGSSLFLKNRFGAGYNLTIVKEALVNGEEDKSHALTEFIQQHVPAAKVLSNVGSEIGYQLPIDSSPVFPEMFRALESKETQTALRITSFGISVTTLEEVFIKVAEMGDDDGQHTLAKEKVQKGLLNSYSIQKHQLSKWTMFIKHFFALIQKRFRVARRDKRVMIFSTGLPCLLIFVGFMLLRNSALLVNDPKIRLDPSMSYHSYSQGAKTPLPFICAKDDGGMCSTWGKTATRGVPVQFTQSDLLAVDASVTVFNVSYAQLIAQTTGLFGPSSQTCVLAAEHLYERGYVENILGQYGGYLLYGSSVHQILSYNLFVNTTSIHAAPMHHAMIDEALVKYLTAGLTTDPNMAVTVNNHPFPITAHTRTLFGSFFSFTACLFIVIAMTFFPASIVTFLVKEKQNECNSKHQQLVSGVSLPAFWLANYCFDLLLYVIPFAAALIMIRAFDIQALTGNDCTGCADNTPQAVFLLFFFFGFAIAPFTYCMSYLFKEAASAQFYTLLINMVLGLILMIVSFVLDVISQTAKDANVYLKFIWRLSPLFNLGNGLLKLSLSLIGNSLSKSGTVRDAFSWDYTGYEITYLAVQSVVFFIMALGIDILLSFPKFKAMFSRDPQLPDNTNHVDDQDVAAEAKRVLDGHADKEMVVIKGIKKTYKGNKVAVRNLSFALPKGECFGYLGINGAGKTTTMKMLTGDILPTKGAATLGGFDILTQQLQLRRLIGYCPQFDALIDLLSVREHLELFAKIKGVPASDVAQVVKEKLTQMNLQSFENKLAGTLSGGNKRKLSVAIAMIGSPPIIFLDEPSTGMDPVSRRFMWDIIADVSTANKESTIVLTTHSMEECEALCTRVGIMVGGRLRCLGSVQHLKSRFGDGFMIDSKLNVPTTEMVGDFFTNTIKGHCPATTDMEWRLTRDQAQKLCNDLGQPDRFGWIAKSHSTGYALDAVLERDGNILALLFASWWLGENQFIAYDSFLRSTFLKVELLERQNEHCRFKLHDSQEHKSLLLSDVFAKMEANKHNVALKEYSVCQTSLEQIFNAFASQQDEEKGVARGMEVKKNV
ncbi:ATP-binding Cassette (ABC) Superfamily [Thraustotheca clavata]|uniref:ATP-binding Cassette (ABC) Superfamily n=1 Tax=Thraustotheca clavata TaxID=74557 RepID=A0A1V9Y6R2_9STRA|nr:ATP-binding Cassette (ABC) Superfamily [Thraustotheca clavata]